MGWKNVKEHYRIGHIVQIEGGNLLIGSPYISDIISVSPAGEILKGYNGSNLDLSRYQQEIASDPAEFQRLFSKPDAFVRSITVYTCDGAEIVERSCEEAGWPNVTHEGELMYENTFSTDRSVVVERARKSAESGVRHLRQMITDAEKSLQDLKALLKEQESFVAKLAEKEERAA